MNAEEIKSIAIDHLYRLNPDLSMYSDEDAALIKEEIKRIQDDRGNLAYDRLKDDGYYNRGKFNIYD